MRSISRSLKGLSVKPTTQRNRAVQLTTLFATSWGSEIHINLNIDAEPLNRRRSRFSFRPTICHIFQRHWRQYAGNCACVYGMCSVRNMSRI